MFRLTRITLAILALLMSLGLGLFFRLDTAQADLEPTGMAKPIADLRDYDGTYYGSPGTGTVSYSGGTLYRDNEDKGATARCNGEGCGSHPGVDIPVPSGTNIYASRSGTVVRSDDTDCTGWGGLIIIKSTSPWNSSQTIYFSYAHLKERKYTSGLEVKVGDYVTTGTRIGKSGGASTDFCHGNSTGAHLHFQIDNDDGHIVRIINNKTVYVPWFPTNVNSADSSFQVTQKTYNPIVFVMGGYRWTFELSGTDYRARELWDLINFSTWGVTGGYIWMDGNYDPYVRRGSSLISCGLPYPCSSSIAAEAAFYKRVHLKMYNYCVKNPLKVYFITSSDATWNEAKSITYNLAGTGASDIHVTMSSNSNWKGIITGLRVDPAVDCNPYAVDKNQFYNITIER